MSGSLIENEEKVDVIITITVSEGREQDVPFNLPKRLEILIGRVFEDLFIAGILDMDVRVQVTRQSKKAK